MGKPCKVVAIGDSAVGKTCLLHMYVTNKFPDEYIPTVFNTTSVTAYHKEQKVTLELYDTAGQEDYDALRTLSYPKTDVFLLCYAVNDPQSLASVQTKWLPEIKEELKKQFCVILVGTKVDLRDNPNTAEIVSSEQGKETAEKIGAHAHMECSAMRGEGVKEIFDKILSLYTDNKQRQDCIIS
eukprot:gb/GECH01008167.1/.p1 GENE.gb/GECH01008167.1/~~gb/GECH01008167.1/.p1  ORF type:complete len:183 (+),score=42.88 gb/GECH01008167.1/:1-549(+)